MVMEVDDQVTIAEKFAILEKEYRKSQSVIQMLNKKVSFLEKELISNNSKDDSITVIDDPDALDETEILINKTNGYRRDGPHAQPKPSNPGTLVYQCKECKFMLETKGLLSAHEKNHSEMKKLSYSCEKCDSKFVRSSDLKDHLVEHEERNIEQFNCYDCSFQGSNPLELDRHVIATKHIPRSKSNPDNIISCHSCGEKYCNKEQLMKHRKAYHQDILKRCRYFEQGNCAYESNICWYRHDNLTEQNNIHSSNEEVEIFTCRFCEETFRRKSEFMMHKKTHHEQAVPKCRENQLGKCVYSGIECWYKHEEMSFVYDFDKASKPSGFQMAPENNLPPEMMLRIMTMMEKLILKVDKLEKASQNLN